MNFIYHIGFLGENLFDIEGNLWKIMMLNYYMLEIEAFEISEKVIIY
jgi:hypothetical protein